MSWTRTRVFPRGAAQLLVGLTALAVVTAVCFQLGLNATATAFFYLIVIVLLSLMGRFLPLAALSVVAVACLNYFFVPPVLAFRINDPLEVVELGAFLITALVTTRFVSRSRLAERLLAERARLLDLTHDAVFVRDMQGEITYWNRGAEELFGWTSEQTVGRVSHELLQTRFPEPLANITTQVFRTGRWEGELVHTKRDGTRIIDASRWALQRDESGDPVAFLETVNNITERKQAEDELRASEARFRTLIDHATDTFFLHDERGTILDVNRHACASLGYTREELVGMTASEFDLDMAPGFVQQRFDAGEEIVTFESRHRRKDGTVFPVEIRARRFLWQDGRQVGLSLGRDITERKKAEEALQKAQAALTHVTRVATVGEVTASFAHELNQPLAAIANNANACLGLLTSERPDLDEVREALADVVSDAGRAGAIIERVRGLAKHSVSEQVPIRLADVVNDIVALAGAESLARRVTIRTDVLADLPVVLGDRVQLQQVLLNLVVNAMDAMSTVDEPQRALEIRGQQDDTQGGSPAVRISVADRGIGLRAGQAEQIFEAFYTTKPHGMGLGLAISRSIIEAHGGHLWAESNRGRGASFSFRLPAATASAAA